MGDVVSKEYVDSTATAALWLPVDSNKFCSCGKMLDSEHVKNCLVYLVKGPLECVDGSCTYDSTANCILVWHGGKWIQVVGK